MRASIRTETQFGDKQEPSLKYGYLNTIGFYRALVDLLKSAIMRQLLKPVNLPKS